VERPELWKLGGDGIDFGPSQGLTQFAANLDPAS
jgi:hypothetical protein